MNNLMVTARPAKKRADGNCLFPGFYGKLKDLSGVSLYLTGWIVWKTDRNSFFQPPIFSPVFFFGRDAHLCLYSLSKLR